MTKEFTGTDYKYIQTNKPVLVAQFIKGSTAAAESKDPAMLVLSPTAQLRPQYTFSTVRTDDLDFKHYLMVVIEQTKLSRLQLDKTIVDQSGWTVFPGTNPTMVGKAIEIETGVLFVNKCITIRLNTIRLSYRNGICL